MRADQLSDVLSDLLGRHDVGGRELDNQRFQFWVGASGVSYVHSVYDLQACPELPEACYILVARTASGSAMPLHVGQTCAQAPSLNLAQVRQRAAKLGANEVHVHLLAQSYKERCLVAFDLSANAPTALAAETGQTRLH
ncbi:MAG: hypothetical protein ACFCUN_00895 [Hyphomicrobiaceae bacterium]